MQFRIDISSKKIELLESVPFAEIQKLVNTLAAAYGWDINDVQIKSKVEVLSSGPIFVERRTLPWYHSTPYQSYQVFCASQETTGDGQYQGNHSLITVGSNGITVSNSDAITVNNTGTHAWGEYPHTLTN